MNKLNEKIELLEKLIKELDNENIEIIKDPSLNDSNKIVVNFDGKKLEIEAEIKDDQLIFNSVNVID